LFFTYIYLILQDLVFTQMSCDEVLFVLISKTETISATEKISLIQFLNRLAELLQNTNLKMYLLYYTTNDSITFRAL